MSERRYEALRQRVIRGATPGEREAALNALVKAPVTVPAKVPAKTSTTLAPFLVFASTAALAAVWWSWGFWASFAVGLWCRWLVIQARGYLDDRNGDVPVAPEDGAEREPERGE